ncbi:hypothetical protein QZH41_015931 [Actinostola sp. cb2023]|nr:hypothetical protein QZH41_015931 [Actinostola sp. cb2023]
MYAQEVVDQGRKVEKMKEDKKDEHDIRKQIEVLEESKVMIPDCKRRIRIAYSDLQGLLADSEVDLKEKEEFKQAKQMLEQTVIED